IAGLVVLVQVYARAYPVIARPRRAADKRAFQNVSARKVKQMSEPAWRGDDTRLWITNLPRSRARPADLARLLRGHQTIENPVHWVRDVSWNEDRGHGRAVGVDLAALRNTALNWLRGRGF